MPIGHTNVVKQLLDRRMDVEKQSGIYGNVLQRASQRGHAKVVQLLLDKDVEVNAQGGLHAWS
jgi:hypothetical protein